MFFATSSVSWADGSIIPASRWPVCDPGVISQKISFVHVSDTHASYNPDPDGSSPLARIRGLVEEVKRENPYTLFTDAGDDYEKGSIAEQLSHGRTTRQVVQAMHYDIRTLGNHDFAWGLEELLDFSHDPTALVLAGNTKITREVLQRQGLQEPGWVDYAQLTVGCVKIGVFGLVSKPWTENGEQYDGPWYRQHPELQSNFNHVVLAREIIARHRPEVDLLVLVSHLGIYDDVHLAEETEGIDIILGGHTHTTMTEPRRIGNTTIIHAGSYGEHIGRYDLVYDLDGRRIAAGHFELVANNRESVPVDEETDLAIKKIIRPYQEAISAEFVRINQEQSKKDMARIAARATVETGRSDAAFVNPQSAWKKGLPGGLTRQDILDIFPVEREPAGEPGLSSLYLVSGTGADLLQIRTALPDFAYWGPVNIHPAAIYTIALPKAQALGQQKYFGREISPEVPGSAGELWEAVVDYGRDQSRVNLSLDERGENRNRGLIAAIFDRR
ncbi:MAG: metallophosphoesterase [Pseudomonadota bacterium]